MKFKSIYISIVVVAAILFAGSVFAQMRVGQSSDAKVIKPAVDVKKTVESSSRFASAALDNARVRTSMQWSFGRPQTGWEIYTSLIAKTIGAEQNFDTPEFAMAVSKWQSNNAIQPTGVVDDATFRAFMKEWQSQRLKGWSYPELSLLYDAPITDFYDATRDPELLKLDAATYIAYKKMVMAAAKDLKGVLKVSSNGDLAPEEKMLRIVSGFRSREYQAELRRREPGAGRAALAVNSPHASGHAIDLYVGGKPVSTKDENRLVQVQTPAYKWLVKNANKFGFYNYFYEPWHWEYVPLEQAK